MAFLLGSFTSGLFGGMRDVSDIMNNWETLKQRRLETKRQQDMMDAADKTKAAMESDNAKTPAATPSAMTTNSAPTKAPEAPDLNSVPLPDFMKKAAKAVSPAGASAEAPTDFFGTSPPVAAPTDFYGTSPPSTTTKSSNTGGAIQRALGAVKNAASKAGSNFAGAFPYVTPEGGIPLTPIDDGSSSSSALPLRERVRDALQSMVPSALRPASAIPTSPDAGEATQTSPAQPVVQPRTTAPNYLPPMSSAAPTAPTATPSLGIGQAGLGAQILAALNPVYGPRA